MKQIIIFFCLAAFPVWVFPQMPLTAQLPQFSGLPGTMPAPIAAMTQPQKLMTYWGNEAMPMEWYTEQEIILQQRLNKRESDAVRTYLPLEASISYAGIDQEAITPYTWKWVKLRMAKADGTISKISLRRPNWWIQQKGADKIGHIVHINLPEMGLQGDATVLQILPNQLDTRFWQEKRQGDYILRPITAKFEHQSDQVAHYFFEGLDQPIGATASHLFWSVDHQTWQQIRDFEIGQRVKTPQGVAVLKAIQPLPGLQTVYNLEVYRDHNYAVSDLGILVHNDCLPDVRWIKHDIWNELKRANLQKKFKKAMDKGLAESRKDASGIIRLTDNEVVKHGGHVYKHKIKDPNTGWRLYGRIDENGALIFDHLTKK
ncbi:MAG: hypothetical protein AAFR61_31490 [Bacteroidota bacterium]